MPLSAIDPEQYQNQLEGKVTHITRLFSKLSIPTPEVFKSPPLHYRMRAEFKIWHDNNDCYYAMFKPENRKKPYRIDNFPIGAQTIDNLMPQLMNSIRLSEQLKQRLFQIEFLSTLSGEILVTLIYHKFLDTSWEEEAQQLENLFNIHIIGRSKKQRLVLSKDYVTEKLQVGSRIYSFQQTENSFTQPNAKVNEKMLAWALKYSKNNQGDLLELYCGNGNFTIAISENFNKVLATEISKTSVKSAQYNFHLNGIENITIVRMSSEELTSALNKERAFRRLQNIELDDYAFSTILVDPPRAGLDKATEQLASRFDNIIYISCNPETLYDNLKSLITTHDILHFAIFDQFPYTHHIESGVILKRRS